MTVNPYTRPFIAEQPYVQARGFALIATISVMVLLVMIALAMLSLSTLELRSSQHSDAKAVARANARMALMIAIGKLQKETGSDQSITTSAGVLSHAGFSKLDAHTSKQHFLMAFNTRNPSGDWTDRRTDGFRCYLVSGDETNVTDLGYGSRGITTSADTVHMTDENTPADHQVNVSLVAVSDSSGKRTGSYGYWVAGQGSRASTALVKRSDIDKEHLSPDRFNIRSVDSPNLDWLPDRDKPELLAKAITAKTLEILSPDGKGLDNYQHWITRNDRALLTNPLTGGFKKDLTAAFDASTSSTTMENLIGQRMFPPASGGDEGDPKDPGGPKWAQARSYYQLQAGNGLDVRPQTEDQMGVYPVVAGFTEFYGLCNTVGYAPATLPPFGNADFFNEQREGVNGNAMTMNMSPVVKLWNPYSRSLNASSYTIAVSYGDHQYAGLSPAPMHGDNSSLSWAGSGNGGIKVRLPMAMRYEHRYTIPATSFTPGEVKVFSLRENHFVDSYKRGGYTTGSGPKGKGTVGNIVDMITEGYILGELEEGPFTGHSFWDLHYTTNDAEPYDAENNPDTFYVNGRGVADWPYPGGATDGSKTQINSSRQTTKRFKIEPGEMVNWNVDLYQGKVPKSKDGSTVTRPLVSIKNINTATNGLAKEDPDLNDIGALHDNVPYFVDANLDGIWSRSISLRLPENNGEADPSFLNPSSHGTKHIKWLGDFNLRSPTVGCWAEEYTKKSSVHYAGEKLVLDGQPTGGNGYGLGTPGNYLSGILLNLTSLDDAMPQPFIGYSDIGGPDRCVLFDVPETTSPEKHFFSVGQLRHANLTIENGNYLTQLNKKYGMEDFFSDNMRPAYAIGESLPDIHLQPGTNNGTHRTMSIVDGTGSYESTHYDFSWYMNKVWDIAFFSARNAGNQGETSHNPRISLISSDQPLEIGDKGMETNASRVFLMGAFNVNSTSVEAWHAFLTATLGAELDGASDPDRAPFSRVVRPLDGQATESTNDQDVENYTGFRGLSRAEIEKLSTKLVTEIKLRGPFLSLAEFVNRAAQDGAPDELSRKGALQAAIDNAELNKHLTDADTMIDAGDVSPIYNTKAYAGDVGHSIAGYITQGDILARMGHLLTTRSDTFTVRAYGEARDQSGRVTARAWCEAEVQRFPEYLDRSDDTITPHDELTSESNKNFGRKYRVTAFRWIPIAEIQ